MIELDGDDQMKMFAVCALSFTGYKTATTVTNNVAGRIYCIDLTLSHLGDLKRSIPGGGSMFGAGNNWMARSVLRQSRGSLRKISQRSSYQYSSNIQVGQWQIRDPRSLLSESKLCLLKLKEFRGDATLQKIATELSKSKFNTGKNLVVRCILGKNRGRVLENFPGGLAPTFLDAVRLTLMVRFFRFLSTFAEYRSFLLAHLRTLFTSGLLAKYVK